MPLGQPPPPTLPPFSVPTAAGRLRSAGREGRLRRWWPWPPPSRPHPARTPMGPQHTNAGKRGGLPCGGGHPRAPRLPAGDRQQPLLVTLRLGTHPTEVEAPWGGPVLWVFTAVRLRGDPRGDLGPSGDAEQGGSPCAPACWAGSPGPQVLCGPQLCGESHTVGTVLAGHSAQPGVAGTYMHMCAHHQPPAALPPAWHPFLLSAFESDSWGPWVTEITQGLSSRSAYV